MPLSEFTRADWGSLGELQKCHCKLVVQDRSEYPARMILFLKRCREAICDCYYGQSRTTAEMACACSVPSFTLGVNSTVGPLFIDCITMAQAINCGFARVAVFLSGQQKSVNGKVSEVKSLDLPLEAMFRSS